MQSNETLVFFIFLGAAGGFLLGALTLWLVSGRGKPDTTEQETLPPGIERGQFVPAARLWFERGSGKLFLESGGKTFGEAGELPEKLRQQMQTLAAGWCAWLGLPAAPKPTAVSTQNESARTAAPAPTLTRSPAVKEPVEAPRPEALSIVAQIDEILQEMLLSSTLESKAIRLEEDAQHGVTVWVGIERFSGIDSVQDPEIQALIRAAVAEWERRASQKQPAAKPAK